MNACTPAAPPVRRTRARWPRRLVGLALALAALCVVSSVAHADGQCTDRDRDGCLPPPCGPDCNDTVASVGCRLEVCDDGRDNDCDGDVDCRDADCGGDADQDGCLAVPCGKDCDDQDAAVGCRRELCEDGRDNDCNGATDCADSACTRDADRDGCLPPPCGDDCNDTVASVGCRVEICDDNRDNDCDGEIDCRDSDCNRDDDRDGCFLFPCGDDCDDQDPTIGCVVEHCNDFKDNDCDGDVDCGDRDCDGASCDDGIFCNGIDRCGGGICRRLGEDPCAGPDHDGDCSESCSEDRQDCSAPDPDGTPCMLPGGLTTMDMCQAGICVAGPPRNDHCITAFPIDSAPFVEVLDVGGAGRDPADQIPPCSGKVPGAPTVWYRYTAPADGTVIANTFTSGYDTSLVAYTGTCTSLIDLQLSEIGCSSDAGGGVQSEVALNAVAGTTYTFMVGSEMEAVPAPHEKQAPFLHFSLSFLETFSNCCASQVSGVGCDAPECQSCVCGTESAPADPACCTEAWDDSCVVSATNPGRCASECPCGICGDGVVQLGEECDDGNTVAGDGCDASCMLSEVVTTTTTTTTPPGSTSTTVAVTSLAAGGDCSSGSCSAQPLAAKRLGVKVTTEQPRKSRIVAVMKGINPLPSGIAAPTEGGARLTIRDAAGRVDRFELPAAAWRGLGRPRGSEGYVYRDARGRHGACTKARLRGRSIKLLCRGPAITLEPPLEGTVEVLVETGSAASGSATYCAHVGGHTLKNRKGVFLAIDARAPGRCFVQP